MNGCSQIRSAFGFAVCGGTVLEFLMVDETNAIQQLELDKTLTSGFQVAGFLTYNLTYNLTYMIYSHLFFLGGQISSPEEIKTGEKDLRICCLLRWQGGGRKSR